MALGDSIIGLHAQSNVMRTMIEHFESGGVEGVVAFEEVPPKDVVQYGIAEPRNGRADEVFELVNLIEKPSVSEAPSNLAVAARYVFAPSIFDCLARDPARQGKRNPVDRRDPHAHSRRRASAWSPPAR